MSCNLVGVHVFGGSLRIKTCFLLIILKAKDGLLFLFFLIKFPIKHLSALYEMQLVYIIEIYQPEQVLSQTGTVTYIQSLSPYNLDF